MTELTAAFIVGWIAKSFWDCFLKPVFSNAIKEYCKEKNT
jgi:hypothetical protein